MAKIVVIEHLTLDGVYQGPGRADEDRRGGFEHGGWPAARAAPEMQAVIGRVMATGWSLLVGRTTYEDLYQSWPVLEPASPMTTALTKAQKYVVSRNADFPLPWKNSTLLAGEAVETVAGLKAEQDKTLLIFGSGVLVRSLMERKFADEFVLMIHPLVLGDGLRFFDATAPFTELKFADATPTATGVIIATYRPA